MGRAEAGSLKALGNKMKAKGLQRLRWYCQVCEKQMRDENGFKCHVQSESHVRQIQIVAEDPRTYIQRYSNQFLREFVNQLRVSHGTKQVDINQFYQEYISHKEHVHMNATQWSSLTQFAAHLGREGIATVDMPEDGAEGGLRSTKIALIDNSPEALRRREHVRKKEAMAKADEEREKAVIEDQVRRANAATGKDGSTGNPEADDASRQLHRSEGETIKLNIALGPSSTVKTLSQTTALPEPTSVSAPVKMKINPLASGSGKKNALAGLSSGVKKSKSRSSDVDTGSGRKMTEMQRIMLREMDEHKRRADRGRRPG